MAERQPATSGTGKQWVAIYVVAGCRRVSARELEITRSHGCSGSSGSRNSRRTERHPCDVFV